MIVPKLIEKVAWPARLQAKITELGGNHREITGYHHQAIEGIRQSGMLLL